MKKKLLKLIGIFVSATLVVSSSNALSFTSFAEEPGESIVVEESTEETVEESEASIIEEIVGEETNEESIEEQTDSKEPVEEPEEPALEPSEELDYVLGRPMTEEEIDEQVRIAEEHLLNPGYVSPNIEVEKPNMVATTRGVLESKYSNANLVNKIRNQGSYGICWAYSAVNCAEINIKNKGLAGPTDTVDLSPFHLAYNSSNLVADPLGNSVGDDFSYSGTNYLKDGGNGYYVKDTLGCWRGLADNSVMSDVDLMYNAESLKTNTALAYGDEYHLSDFSVTGYSIGTVKNCVKEYGAVSISFYASELQESETSYYNHSTAACYYPYKTTPNHAVTVVGWDDNYSRDNFTTKPANDGAWIVLNSWGSGFGKNGYFYLSYEDKSIEDFVYVYDFESADKYDNNYQYSNAHTYVVASNSISLSYNQVNMAANIYEIKANNGGSELLEAVSVDVDGNNTRCNIKVYLNPEEDDNGAYKPTTGTLIAQQQEIFTYPGFHIVDIEDVVLNAGDVISVVCDFGSNSYGRGLIAIEPIDYTSGNYKQQSSKIEKQSYTFDKSQSSYWYDQRGYGGNYAIRAYTSNYENVPCTGVVINNKTNLKVNIGETLKLSATVKPANATNKKVTWKSSDETKATVSGEGVVTGISEGTVEITVTTVDGSYIDSCMVQITDVQYDYIDSVTLDKTSLNMWSGDTYTLIPAISPANVTNKALQWTSSNTSVATVSTSGKVTAVGSGTATITCTTVLSGKKATCSVSVNQHVTGVSLDKSSLVIDLGSTTTTEKLTATVAPASAYDKSVTWSSSNSSVATVDLNGNVKALKCGTTTITVKTTDGNKTATCVVTVTCKVKSVSLYPTTLSLNVGEYVNMWPTISPSNAENKNVTWTSSNSGVATVDASGKISAKAPGTAIITVKTVDGGKTATCTVTVDNKLTGIQLKVTNPVIYVGDTFTPTVIYTPANPTDVVWSSSNTKVATVSAKGVVTGLSAGTSTIKVGNKAGTMSSTYTITVRAKSTPAPTPTYSYTIKMQVPGGYSSNEIYVDGIAYNASITNGNYMLTLPNGNAKSAVAYKYNDKGVPTGMYVWTLRYVGYEYVVTAQPELQDLLTYHGFSIRVTGKTGIRCKTGIDTTMRQKLTTTGVNGYKLTEYGTLVMANNNRSSYPMIRNGEKVKTGIAYGMENGKKVDNIYETTGGRYRYTAVLIGLPNTQYKTEYAFRGYAVVNKDGQDIVIYGPVVARSIYNLSKQALATGSYAKGSAADTFLNNIIRDAK